MAQREDHVLPPSQGCGDGDDDNTLKRRKCPILIAALLSDNQSGGASEAPVCGRCVFKVGGTVLAEATSCITRSAF